MNNKLNDLIGFLQEKGIHENEYNPYLEALSKQLKDKKYGLVWEDKDEKVYQELLDKLPLFKDVPEKTIITDVNKPVNLLIEGDNLHSLKSLIYTHKENIDVIYIDPPYNTGNKDFIYNDTYVDKDDSWRHSKWLSFMEKRLILTKSLLREDGVIFISIGEEELAQLKLLCDDIFNYKNYISLVSRVQKNSSNKGTFFAPTVDYILCYAKDKSKLNIFKDSVDKSLYKKVETTGDRKGEYFRDDVALYQSGLKGSRENCRYYIDAPDGSKLIPPVGKFWRWGPETCSKNKHLLVFKKSKQSPLLNEFGEQASYNIYVKSYLIDREEKGVTPRNLITDYVNRQGTDLLNKMGIDFSFSKPVELVKYLISITQKNNDITILDFFAGSGTTGQAVLELNNNDDGNRQFILCTNNENNICEEITYQRLNKVINGYTTSNNKEIRGINSNLKYYKVELYEDEADEDDTIDNLIDKCTDLISIKENCFCIDRFDDYDVVYDKDKAVLIYKYTLPFSFDVTEVAKHLDKYNVKEKVLYSVYTEGIQLNGITLKEFPIEIIEKIKTRSVK